jgi:hypothetical protein
MNELELIFTDLFAFVEELIKDYGEPVSPSPKEIEALTRKIVNNPANNDPYLQKHFYLIERVSGEILFSHNVDRFLGLEGDFDLMDFHSHIQDGVSGWHYLKDYLTWGKVGYLYFREIAKDDDIRKYSFKTNLPMMLRDGRVYWVLQESRALELDKNNNMVSHINNYTIGQLYKEKEPMKVAADFYREGEYCDEWNRLYIENRYAVKPYLLSLVQKQIVDHYHQNPNTTMAECSQALHYPRNTLKKYISDCQRKQGIIDKTKTSFPEIPIRTLKDVVKHLDNIGWFHKHS